MIDALSRRGLLLVLVLVAAGGFAASSDERDDEDHEDHEEAYRALQEGQTKPLAEILAAVEEQFDDEVVGVEFEREGGRYVYELKIVGPDGRLREVYVDALTAEILSGEHD